MYSQEKCWDSAFKICLKNNVHYSILLGWCMHFFVIQEDDNKATKMHFVLVRFQDSLKENFKTFINNREENNLSKNEGKLVGLQEKVFIRPNMLFN